MRPGGASGRRRSSWPSSWSSPRPPPAATGSRTFGEVRYRLVVGRLDSVEVTGSGDVRVDSVAAPAFEVSVEGSGDVRAVGLTADVVTTRISATTAQVHSRPAPRSWS
ncbi:MAG: hypothetical protein ACKVZ6_11570 [Kineosporiaceae bacterium]